MFNSYVLPIFKETTSNLCRCKYFTVLDCYSGFCLVSIKKEHKKHTGFAVPFGHHELNHLQFGLTNYRLNFQVTMDDVFKNW